MKKVSRRKFLQGLGLTAAAAAAAACQPKTVVVKEVVKETVQVEKEVQVEVEKVVKETVVVEKEVEKKVEVEKVVKETVVIEKEVQVTAAVPPKPGKVLHWGRGAQETEVVWEGIKAIAKDMYPEVEVELGAPPDNFNQKRMLLFAAGAGPDTWPQGLSVFRSDIGLGVIRNLQPYFDAEPDAYERFKNDFVQVSVDAYSFEGQAYGIPTVTEGIILWYNVDAIEEAGLPQPREIENDPDEWNWDTLLKYAKALTKGTGFDRERFGIYCIAGKSIYGMSEAWGNLVYAAGGRVLSDDGLQFTMNTPETAQALQYVVDLIHVHDVHPNPDDLTAAGVRDRGMFQNGLLGMVWSGEYFKRYLWGTNAPSGGFKFKYDLAQVPFCPFTGKRTNIYHGNGTAMSARAKDPDAAWKWLKVVMTLEAQKVISANWGTRAAHNATLAEWVSSKGGGGPDGLNYEAIPNADADTYPYPTSPVATVQQIMNPMVRIMYDNIFVGKMRVEDGLAELEAEVTEILDKALADFNARQ